MTAISEVLYRGSLIAQASRALILLHGRGGAAQDILSLADKLGDPDFYIAAPQATNHSWYPYSFMAEETKNEAALSCSLKSVKELIDQTARYISTSQIYIVGFSQGACLALEVSARFAVKYGGIVAFTGGLIGSVIKKDKYQGDFQRTKIFISNGDQDPHIPLIRSKESKESLEKMNAQVTLKIYKGRPHIITEDEIKFAKANIFSALP